jgi:tripartite-type tricarboxylate transporter receptor subunit TctC
LLAPAGTPATVVNQINKEVARILELPDVKERIHAISFVLAPDTPAECTSTLRGELETLRKVVADAGLRPRH